MSNFIDGSYNLVNIQDVKKGDFITKKSNNKVYIRGEYCRFNKAYECTDFDDINRQIYIKKNTLVKIDFTF